MGSVTSPHVLRFTGFGHRRERRFKLYASPSPGLTITNITRLKLLTVFCVDQKCPAPPPHLLPGGRHAGGYNICVYIA